MLPAAPTNKQNNVALAALPRASRPRMLPVETGVEIQGRQPCPEGHAWRGRTRQVGCGPAAELGLLGWGPHTFQGTLC